MTLWTIATHLTAFLAGGLTVRVITLRYVRAVEHDGHPALEFTPGEPMPTPRRTTSPWVLVLVAALVVVGIGAQAYLAARDNADRDARDRDYADCLTDFAADLVTTIERRSRATTRLDQAKSARDAATDRVIQVVVLARRIPPEATEAEFDRALEEQLDAQQRFRRVQAETVAVRRANQYVLPNAVCPRR